MRKIIMMLLVLAMTVCGAVGIAACGKDPEPEQNQGQVEQNKDKDKEEVKPGQNENDKGEEEKEDGKGDTGSETPAKPGENDPPVTPEPQKPNPETPPQDEEQKEEDKDEDKKDEDKKDEDKKDDGKEEEPPQGNEPEVSEPGTEEQTKPEEKPQTQPETKPSEPEKKPEEKEPEVSECKHEWTYQAYGDDRNSRKHVGTCKKCGVTSAAENCKFGSDFTFVEETCTKDGYNLYTCTVCGIGFESQIWDGPNQQHRATGHNFLNGYVFIGDNNTCKHERKCTNKDCDYSEIKTCTLKASNSVDFCKGQGGTVKTCTECGHQVLPEGSSDSHGHQLIYDKVGDNQHKVHCARYGCNYTTEPVQCELNKEEIPATCTEDGTITQSCECGRKNVTKIPAKGHQYEGEVQRDHDNHTGKCSVCQQTATESHRYGNSNLCDVCKYDGIGSAGGYRLFDTKNHYCYLQSNNQCKNRKVIILAKDALGAWTLTKIWNDAFSGNKNLVTVFIPSSVTKIEEKAFSGCSNLKNIFFEAEENSCSDLKSAIQKDLGNSDNLNFQYSKKPEDALEAGEQKENTPSAATIFALPAEVGKRVYA